MYSYHSTQEQKSETFLSKCWDWNDVRDGHVCWTCAKLWNAMNDHIQVYIKALQMMDSKQYGNTNF